MERLFLEAVTFLADRSDCSQHRHAMLLLQQLKARQQTWPFGWSGHALYNSLLLIVNESHHPTRATKKVPLAARSVNTCLLCWLAQS